MTTDRDIEITYPLPEFIAELRRLADVLESGEPFDIDGEQITVPEHAVFSIEHEREDGSAEIEFQLKWDVLDEDEEDEDDEDEDEDEDESDDAEADDGDAESEAEPTSAPA